MKVLKILFMPEKHLSERRTIEGIKKLIQLSRYVIKRRIPFHQITKLKSLNTSQIWISSLQVCLIIRKNCNREVHVFAHD